MRPLPYVLPYALAFWLAFLRAFSPEFRIVRNAQREQGSTDSRTLQVITRGQVTRGAYRILRHPSYTAGILLNTGVGIALGSRVSTLILALVSCIVYLYRIRVEERALAATIGEPYRQFMSGRKRLVPFVY